MIVNSTKTLEEYRNRVADLYGQIEEWLSAKQFNVVKQEVKNHEESIGSYTIECLSIKDTQSNMIAELIPVGASVIGAQGRIDLVGKYDREIIVYLDRGGPQITTTITTGDMEERHTRDMFKGVNGAGWYWYENNRLMKVRAIDRSLFLELLEEVSEYEFST